eukprot:gene3111-604_t
MDSSGNPPGGNPPVSASEVMHWAPLDIPQRSNWRHADATVQRCTVVGQEGDSLLLTSLVVEPDGGVQTYVESFDLVSRSHNHVYTLPSSMAVYSASLDPHFLALTIRIPPETIDVGKWQSKSLVSGTGWTDFPDNVTALLEQALVDQAEVADFTLDVDGDLQQYQVNPLSWLRLLPQLVAPSAAACAVAMGAACARCISGDPRYCAVAQADLKKMMCYPSSSSEHRRHIRRLGPRSEDSSYFPNCADPCDFQCYLAEVNPPGKLKEVGKPGRRNMRFQFLSCFPAHFLCISDKSSISICSVNFEMQKTRGQKKKIPRLPERLELFINEKTVVQSGLFWWQWCSSSQWLTLVKARDQFAKDYSATFPDLVCLQHYSFGGFKNASGPKLVTTFKPRFEYLLPIKLPYEIWLTNSYCYLNQSWSAGHASSDAFIHLEYLTIPTPPAKPAPKQSVVRTPMHVLCQQHIVSSSASSPSPRFSTRSSQPIMVPSHTSLSPPSSPTHSPGTPVRAPSLCSSLNTATSACRDSAGANACHVSLSSNHLIAQSLPNSPSPRDPSPPHMSVSGSGLIGIAAPVTEGSGLAVAPMCSELSLGAIPACDTPASLRACDIKSGSPACSLNTKAEKGPPRDTRHMVVSVFVLNAKRHLELHITVPSPEHLTPDCRVLFFGLNGMVMVYLPGQFLYFVDIAHPESGIGVLCGWNCVSEVPFPPGTSPTAPLASSRVRHLIPIMRQDPSGSGRSYAIVDLDLHKLYQPSLNSAFLVSWVSSNPKHLLELVRLEILALFSIFPHALISLQVQAGSAFMLEFILAATDLALQQKDPDFGVFLDQMVDSHLTAAHFRKDPIAEAESTLRALRERLADNLVRSNRYEVPVIVHTRLGLKDRQRVDKFSTYYVRIAEKNALDLYKDVKFAHQNQSIPAVQKFTILEQHYCATEQFGLVRASSFDDTFTSLGFAVLPRTLFIQFLERRIFQINIRQLQAIRQQLRVEGDGGEACRSSQDLELLLKLVGAAMHNESWSDILPFLEEDPANRPQLLQYYQSIFTAIQKKSAHVLASSEDSNHEPQTFQQRFGNDPGFAPLTIFLDKLPRHTDCKVDGEERGPALRALWYLNRNAFTHMRAALYDFTELPGKSQGSPMPILPPAQASPEQSTMQSSMGTSKTLLAETTSGTMTGIPGFKSLESNPGGSLDTPPKEELGTPEGSDNDSLASRGSSPGTPVSVCETMTNDSKHGSVVVAPREDGILAACPVVDPKTDPETAGPAVDPAADAATEASSLPGLSAAHGNPLPIDTFVTPYPTSDSGATGPAQLASSRSADGLGTQEDD